jgi:hypothetical protein
MLTMDDTPPATPRRSSQDVPLVVEEKEEGSDSGSRDGASTPIPRRMSFMDFSEDAEDEETKEDERREEEAPPPPPPKRPPVPVPVPRTNSLEAQPQTVRSASTSPPPLPPHRPAPIVPQASAGKHF